MFNIFKRNNEQAKNDGITLQSSQQENIGNKNSNVASENSDKESEKKNIHGQDGVCCGSCGGE